MKRFVCLFAALLCISVVNAQTADYKVSEKQSEEERRVHYKEVVTQIFKDDELFVLFYLNLALVVDPTKDTQVVEPITTENPWESLKEYIKGKSIIYFCPSGSQLSIAIEYMPCPIDPDILMSDRYGMYRLSSPEELFKNRGESFRNTKHKAVVFGGLKYDEETKPTNDNLLAFRGKREAIGGYNYLRYTLDEAVYIDSIFRKNGIETALLTGKDGTEKSFAQIPNSKADILHIASHGDYNPNKDNLQSSSLQEWMMSHSWLALSGANIDLNNGNNDGRLTAYEISQTDLSRVNLVVLSACKTGKGDVKENDVYGLLKGFKKAGAGTLLVTLSEVNDTVASLLMMRFYDNIFRGDNPRRALENAQRYIRLLGKGKFNRSEDWEPFILVDDLDRNVGKDVSDITKKEFLTIIETDKIYSENDLFPNWKEIRKQLRESDAIVRICPYSTGKDTVDYVAMIGDPSNGRCNVVRLFSINNKKIGSYSIENKDREMVMYDIPFSYMDSIFCNAIMPFVSKKKTLLCQFAGVLNNYPLEYLPSINNYSVYRLSSLNQLCTSRKNYKTGSVAALFGGLQYDESDEVKSSYPFHPLDRGIIDVVPYLYGTKVETAEISRILRKAGMDVWLYQDLSGTEKIFKKFSGYDKTRIVHLATHAFISDDVIHSTSLSDCLLNHNAIAFSGAASFLFGEETKPQKEDGVLFGGEIVQLDFSMLSLLTLSTCQPVSVKGDSVSNYTESPWDLVKAFKMSGVNAILYSLWNVDDEATSSLMVEFYKNLMNGNNKQEALKIARESVRLQKEKGWDNPRYWASFVLIDALD